MLTSDYTTKLSKQYGTGAKNRNIDQCNRVESTERSPCICGHLIFDKGGKNIQWRKHNLFNKLCWENRTATCNRISLEHSLTSQTKINSKWIKDLNVRPETVKLSKENISRTFFDTNRTNIFLHPPLRNENKNKNKQMESN